MVQNIKNEIGKEKMAGIVYNLMVKTNSEFADYLTGTRIGGGIEDIVDGITETFDTLKEFADYLTAHQHVYEALESFIANKVDGITETFDTLKEFADYLTAHQHVYEALESFIANKVDEVCVEGHNTEGCTSVLKTKLRLIGILLLLMKNAE